MDNRNSYHVKLAKLEEEIVHFDAVLDRIQCLMPYDIKVDDRIIETKDAMFRLQQQMRRCDIVKFASHNPGDAIPVNFFGETSENGVISRNILQTQRSGIQSKKRRCDYSSIL